MSAPAGAAQAGTAAPAAGGVAFAYSDDGAVLDVVLDRPDKRNALSPQMAAAIHAELERAAAGGVHLVVVSSAVDGVFSAGFDIGAMEGASEDPARPLYALYDCLERIPAVTIAYADGLAVGGGVELFLCCDLRLSGPRSTFRLPPTRLSVVYEREGIARFLRRAGQAATAELFLTGRAFTAQEAVGCGLATRLLAPSAIEAYRAEVRAGAPLAQRAMKDIIAQAVAGGRMPDARFEALKDAVAASADRREALAAFREKRTPRFVGR